MIPKGLFTQIGMVIISVAIIITYVEPEFQEIAQVQDNISTYQDERARVSQVNDRLQSLANQLDNVSLSDQERLLDYMPDADQVDQVGVPRDLAIISEEAGVVFTSATFVDFEEAQTRSRGDEEIQPDVHTFSFIVEGTYQQIKALVSLMEQNEYPLQIQSLNVKPLDGSFLTATMQVQTFSFKSELQDSEVVF